MSYWILNLYEKKYKIGQKYSSAYYPLRKKILKMKVCQISVRNFFHTVPAFSNKSRINCFILPNQNQILNGIYPFQLQVVNPLIVV